MPSVKALPRHQILLGIWLSAYNRTPYGRMTARKGGRRGAAKSVALYVNPGTTDGRSKGGRWGGAKYVELYGNPGTPEGRRVGARIANCTRWHGRKKGEPLCPKCQAKLDARQQPPSGA